jgi:L-amino acid N-acyltransferase YncA
VSIAASIRAATAADAAALARIYNYYVANTVITFEETPVSAAEMAARLAATQALQLPWLVADSPGGVCGYAYAGRWKDRSAYRRSVEITVYLDSALTGQGLGTRLYAALFECLRHADVHVAIGGISLPNEASIALHEKFGMHRIGQFREVGFKQGRWVDVGYWQCVLPEPSSPRPGR